MEKRKFLLVSPMADTFSFLPINISLISAILTNAGYEVRLFETTYYRMPNFEGQKQAAIDTGMFKPVNWDGYGMDRLKEDYQEDFKELVYGFKPDFIGISIFTSFNAQLAYSLIGSIDDNFSGKVIVGGIHALVDLEEIKKNKKVSAIVVGECEEMLIDSLDFLRSSDYNGDNCAIPNFIYRNALGTWIDSGKRTICNIDTIPFLNWDYFDERNFFRPFNGQVLRMGHVEMARGCPFKCPYCINELFHKQFPDFWRVKSVERMLEELDFLKKKYDLDAVKIWDDNLLAMDMQKLAAFASGMKKVGLKFLCHSRPEFLTEGKAVLLANAGCIQMGIGVESGNPKYRNKILRRPMKDEAFIKAFDICRKYKISSTAFIMLGMPDETKEDILMGARLLRKAWPDVIAHAIYVPYKGNSLYEYAKSKGYVDKDIAYTSMIKCYLSMPSITKEEVERLFRFFIFYCRLDDSLYPLINSAENDELIFGKLKKILQKSSDN